MKASELRIGNYVQSIGIRYKVCKLSTSDNNIKGTDSGTTFNLDDTAEPIPLTKELLIESGFEKDEEIKHWFMKDGLCVKMFKTPEFWEPFEDDKTADVKYFHELQNEFFKSTDKELELKQT